MNLIWELGKLHLNTAGLMVEAVCIMVHWFVRPMFWCLYPSNMHWFESSFSTGTWGMKLKIFFLNDLLIRYHSKKHSSNIFRSIPLPFAYSVDVKLKSSSFSLYATFSKAYLPSLVFCTGWCESVYSREYRTLTPFGSNKLILQSSIYKESG